MEEIRMRKIVYEHLSTLTVDSLVTGRGYHTEDLVSVFFSRDYHVYKLAGETNTHTQTHTLLQ